PLALSSSLHFGAIAAFIVVAALGTAPTATTLATEDRTPERMHLVFLAIPGPGGGGGGGGFRQPAPAPKALRQGTRKISSPLPVTLPVPSIVPKPSPPDAPPQPIKSE